jgi:hypothetical protein
MNVPICCLSICFLFFPFSSINCTYQPLPLANAQPTPPSSSSPPPPSAAGPVPYHPFELSYTLNGEEYHLRGNATKGTDVKSFLLVPNVGLEIHLSASDNGEIVLLLPKSMIDNVTSVKSVTSGISSEAQIRQAFSNATHSILQVAIPSGIESVTISAAHVAPEFQITLLTMTTSLAGVMIVLVKIRKKNYTAQSLYT